MRQIEFRGIAKDGKFDGKFVYGFYSEEIIICECFEVSCICIPIHTDRKYLINDIEVYSETVGQLTGLNDKNENPIFEGDVLKSLSGDICVVDWNHIISGFEFNNTKSVYPLVKNSDNYEIVGNIHQNKELLNA